jgi:CheY-like chemotaxis protein
LAYSNFQYRVGLVVSGGRRLEAAACVSQWVCARRWLDKFSNNRDPKMKLRVLVIDDDDVSRALQCSVLKAKGHETLDLPTPIGATRLIQEQTVDAVVIDVMMPAISGDRLAKLLRSNQRFRNLGVVLVSGDSSVELDLMARKAGADAVVNKGRLREEIVQAVENAVRMRSAGGPAKS